MHTPHLRKNGTRHAIKLILHLNACPNNQLLKNAVAIMLRLQLCSARYTAIRMKNCMRSVSAITMENMGNKLIVITTVIGKPYHAVAIDTLIVLPVKNWDSKEDKGKSVMYELYALRLAKKHILG